MNAGGASPEELETLFEDALVLGDADALSSLFGARGLLVAADGRQARGRDQIAGAAGDLCRKGSAYVGGAHRVLQAYATGLVIGRSGIHVARQSDDGGWRLAISLLGTTTRQAEVET